MAGKYALYLPYKVIDSLASGDVTDSQFREFITGLVEYDRTGTFPTSPTPGFTMMYELMKPDLDYAKDKYEKTIESRRQSGRLGGAPKGNKNAAKNRGGYAPEGNQNAVDNRGGGAPPGNQNAKKEESDNEKQTQTQAKQTNQAKQADNSSQNTVISNQNSVIRNSSSEVALQPPPQTNTTEYDNVQKFLEASKNAGFTLDRKAAQDILLDPYLPLDGIEDPYNFTVFVAEYIRDSYPAKPYAEQKRLFLAALRWEDRKDEFPEWRKQKEREAAKMEKREARDRALAVKPEVCPICEAELNGSLRCPCHGYFEFVEKELEYQFREEAGSNFFDEFSRHMKNRGSLPLAAATG